MRGHHIRFGDGMPKRKERIMMKRLILLIGLLSAFVGSVYLARIPVTDHPKETLDWTAVGYATSSD